MKTAASARSLQTRLLAASGALLAVFLGLTGAALDRAFRASVEAGAADRLQVQVYLLLSAVDRIDGEFLFLDGIGEPRFAQLHSGLYGFIAGEGAGELWRSDSARALALPGEERLRRPPAVGRTRFERVAGGDGERYFQLSYGILWEDGVSEYGFSVVENAAPYYAEIDSFRAGMRLRLGGAAALLLLAQFLLLRWGLSPLRRMAAGIKAIESGSRDRLEGGWPRELEGVAANLDMLIEVERGRRERHRTRLHDLAHSLKTPLAVAHGILPRLDPAAPPERRRRLRELAGQLGRMGEIVDHQLRRAAGGAAGAPGRRAALTPAVERTLGALRKVYADKAMAVEAELDPRAAFAGDGQDLMELLGCVLDNAFKYGRGRVRVATAAGDAGGVAVMVEDDGPGISRDRRELALRRGERGDAAKPGQGIGLAVATDIVDSYGGRIRIDAGALGGARVRLEFPGGRALRAESPPSPRTGSSGTGNA